MQVRIDLSAARIHTRHAVVAALSCGFVLTGLLGFAVTSQMESPQILVPARWEALKTQTAVQHEIGHLAVDLAHLASLFQKEAADPVQVMLSAQQLRARYQDGEPATASARAALVGASEVAVREAQGEALPSEVVAALENARVKLGRVMQP